MHRETVYSVDGYSFGSLASIMRELKKKGRFSIGDKVELFQGVFVLGFETADHKIRNIHTVETTIE